jgi:hypothetical protein
LWFSTRRGANGDKKRQTVTVTVMVTVAVAHPESWAGDWGAESAKPGISSSSSSDAGSEGETRKWEKDRKVYAHDGKNRKFILGHTGEMFGVASSYSINQINNSMITPIGPLDLSN